MVLLLIIVAAGIGCGALLAPFGVGLHPAPAEDIATVGRIQVLLPPVQARRLEGVHSFTVQLIGIDDFARVYLNNYLIAEREIKEDDITDGGTLQRPSSDLFQSSLTPRGNFGAGPFEAKTFLRVGRNYLVAELENGPYGTCTAQLDVRINDIAPLGFPAFLGEGFAAEGGVALNQAVIAKNPHGWLANAICARRIYEFELR
ncbi:MAG TPA: hypothetical protein VGR92_04360 [Steroidobacteraceae bacterium]|nr:hypothetical protein [Steroidobacteraceae bacterium]